MQTSEQMLLAQLHTEVQGAMARVLQGWSFEPRHGAPETSTAPLPASPASGGVAELQRLIEQALVALGAAAAAAAAWPSTMQRLRALEHDLRAAAAMVAAEADAAKEAEEHGAAPEAIAGGPAAAAGRAEEQDDVDGDGDGDGDDDGDGDGDGDERTAEGARYSLRRGRRADPPRAHAPAGVPARSAAPSSVRLCTGAGQALPAAGEWAGGRLALAGGDGGAESQGLLGATRMLLEEVERLYRDELPGLSKVIHLDGGGMRDVVHEFVYGEAYTAALLAGGDADAASYDEEGAEVVGAITVQPHRRERYAAVLMCAVLPEHRGRGVGQLLVRWLEQLALSASLRCLLVAAGNDVTGFWTQLGFTAVPDDVPRPWVDGLRDSFGDATVLHRALPASAEEAAEGVRLATIRLEEGRHAKRRRK